MCQRKTEEAIHRKKEYANYPTVSPEAMMMSCGIDAKEGRYINLTDFPGAFLHAFMKDIVNMVLKSTIASTS